jgi:hypothetical protein
MVMNGIPANATPLALLDKLGIKVKSSKSDDIALPTYLGAYLDTIIKQGSLEELDLLIPGINEAVVSIGKSNPVVLLNALIASFDSAEAFFQTGSETVDPEARPNFRHLAHLANYHSKQIEIMTDIASEAGLHNHGLYFEITNEKKFNALIAGLSQIEGFRLDERAQKVFNDIVSDMLFTLSKSELNRTLSYLEKFNSIGLTQIKNDYTQASVSSDDVITSLKELVKAYGDDDAYQKAFDKFECLIAPLNEIE